VSESDIIKVLIDDTELDRALFKANQIILKEGKIMGGKTTLSSRKLWSDWRAFSDSFDEQDRKLTSQLPGINREARILLGQVPMMREAMTVYFRMRRLMHGYNQYLEGEGLGTLYLTLAATAVLLLQQVLAMQRRIRQDQQQYEAWIRRSRNLTHDQYVDLQKEWQSYSRGRPG